MVLSFLAFTLLPVSPIVDSTNYCPLAHPWELALHLIWSLLQFRSSCLRRYD